MSNRNRQARAVRLMRMIAVRMAKKMGEEIESFEIDLLIEIRGKYQDIVGRVDDLIRRFDLLSIIA